MTIFRTTARTNSPSAEFRACGRRHAGVCLVEETEALAACQRRSVDHWQPVQPQRRHNTMTPSTPSPSELADRRRLIAEARQKLYGPRLNRTQRFEVNCRMQDHKHSLTHPAPDPFEAALAQLRERDRLREANR